MALKVKQILNFFLFVLLSFVKVTGFVVFNEGMSLNSLGSFNKNARTKESFDRGEEKPKSGEPVGRLLVWPDKASSSHGDGWMKLQPLWGQVYGLNTLYTPTVERLLEMKPKIDCFGDLMKLTVHGRASPFGSSFLIDRGSVPPLPLSQLPSDCGHRFLKTWRDFVFIIPYDGCYVSQEREMFVLPLLWWGLPVKMSCSSLTSAQKTPTVSCNTNGMIVRLHRAVSENLKIKVMNEWQPLLKVSARCGYSLVSHAEDVVIHVPYMPCIKPKDGMFTVSMEADNKFNLSCPAFSLDFPTSLSDLAPNSMPNALISSTLPPTTITTRPTAKIPQPIRTQSSTTSTSSTVQKLPTPPLPYYPYYIPGQPNFKLVPPSYPVLLFPPNMSPTVAPQGPKIVGPPTAITKQPQVPVYIKPPRTWYPWNPKPSLGFAPVRSQSTALSYAREPSLPPTTAPKPPLASLLKPTSISQDKLVPTMPSVPQQWVPRFPPRNLVYPLYPGKPGFVAPSSTVFPQDPYWPYSQNQPGPSKPHAPPKPESTREAGPQLFQHPLYKPFPPRYSVMPLVPAKVPQDNTFSTSGAVASSSTKYQSVNKPKGPPMNLDFHFAPSTPSLPTLPEVVKTPAPINACLTPTGLSHAHSFHCPTLCPCPPSVSYHHHNHHYFGHPPVSNHDISSLSRITGQMRSSSVISGGLTTFPLVQDMGHNYGPLSSEGAIVPPASDSTAMQYLAENRIVNGAHVPDTSKHLTGPTKCPSIFKKLESPTASTWSTMKPANVAPVIRPLGPYKPPSRPLQNGPFAEPLVYTNQSPKPAVYQKEQYVRPWGHHMQPMLVASNNVPHFEKMVQHEISSKPTMPPAHGKNLYMNRWYQATYSNAKPPISDSPTKDSFSQLSLPQPSSNDNSFEPSTTPPQPEQTSGGNLPVMNSQQYNPQSGEFVVPVFRGTYLVPVLQSNQDASLSRYHPNGLYEASIHSRPRNVESWKQH